jgi:hypothetical protein
VVGDSVVLMVHVVSGLFGQLLLGGWLVVGSLGKIWGSQWWCMVLDGDSRYSNKREPHLVDVGVESFLGVAQRGDDVAMLELVQELDNQLGQAWMLERGHQEMGQVWVLEWDQGLDQLWGQA